MKSWRKPEAVGQEFAANEYVSACTLQVLCDIDNLPNGATELFVPNGSSIDLWGTGDDSDSWGTFGSPCGEVHDVARDTQFYISDFTHGAAGTDASIRFDAPVSVAWWRELNDAGDVVDIHFTSPKNIANPESNKS